MREAHSMDRGARVRGAGRPGPYDRPRGGARDRGLGFDRRRRPGGYIAGGAVGGGYGDGYDEGEELYEDEYYEDEYAEWDDEYDGRYGRRRMPEGRRGYRGGDFYDEEEEWGEEDYYLGEEETLAADYVVHMRGLPFKATDDDITNFFSPIVPVRIYREYGDDGRISGEANVEFASFQDAQAAMQKNRDLIQHRYIELFYRGSKARTGGAGGARSRGAGRGGMAQRSRPLMRDMPMLGMSGPKRPMMRGRSGPVRSRARGYRY